MANKAGYLLPDNIRPDEDWCLVVHVPKDEAYRRALRGTIERLGYWWAWERDEGRNGKEAAQRWRESMDRTLTTWEKYGDLCDMEINITCGCCDSLGNQTTNYNYTWITSNDVTTINNFDTSYEDDGVNPPDTYWPDYATYDVDKCKAATRLADDFLDTLRNMSSFGGMLAIGGTILANTLITTSALSGLIVGLMAVGLSASASIVVLLGIFASMTILGIGVFSYFELVESRFDRDDLVCAFYEATTVAEAKQAILDATDQAIIASLVRDEVGGNVWADKFIEIIDLLFPYELLAILFNGIDVVNSLAGETCDCTPTPMDGMNVQYGTLTDVTGDFYTFRSELFVDGSDRWTQRVQVWIDVNEFNVHDGGDYHDLNAYTLDGTLDISDDPSFAHNYTLLTHSGGSGTQQNNTGITTPATRVRSIQFVSYNDSTFPASPVDPGEFYVTLELPVST